MTQLFLDDEGTISRRQWWIGTLALLAIQFFAESLMARWLGPPGLDGPLMLSLSLAILVPFHAVNAKRFRAIGRPPWLALWGGGVAGLSILAGAFLRLPALDVAIGLALIATIGWFIVDLGVLAHDAWAAPERIDAALRRN
jgi:uncharacterized membrane protein YhaH (DUF805 family)